MAALAGVALLRLPDRGWAEGLSGLRPEPYLGNWPSALVAQLALPACRLLA